MNNTELMQFLKDRGFVPAEKCDNPNNNEYLMYWAEGSISNYCKVWVDARIYYEYSLAADEERVPCVSVRTESFQCPGYVECDWTHTSKGGIAVDKLNAWLESEGCMTSYRRQEILEERRKAREAKRAEYKAKQIV